MCLVWYEWHLSKETERLRERKTDSCTAHFSMCDVLLQCMTKTYEQILACQSTLKSKASTTEGNVAAPIRSCKIIMNEKTQSQSKQKLTRAVLPCNTSSSDESLQFNPPFKVYSIHFTTPSSNIVYNIQSASTHHLNPTTLFLSSFFCWRGSTHLCSPGAEGF